MDRLPDEIDQTARVRHRVASGADVGGRRRINWPAGASLTDDPTNEEVVVNLASVSNVQTMGIYASSQSTGAASSSTIDARSMTILAAGAVSAGLSAGKIVLSAPNTIAQTNQSLGVVASSQTTGQSSSSTIDARSVTLVGQGAVSAGLSAGSILISAPNTIAQTNQTVGVYGSSQTTGGASSSTVDARSITLVGQGAVSVGLTNGSVQISAPNTVAQTNQSAGIYASSQTGGDSSSSTHDARSLTIVGRGAVSAGWTNGSFQISAPNTIAQTNQSLGIIGSSQTTGGSSSSTVDARSVTLVGQGAVSVGLTNGSVQISAPNTVAQTNQSLGVYGSSQTTGGSSSSTVDARSITLVGQGAVSVGLTGGSVQISAPNTVAQTNQSIGVYALSQSTAASSSSTVDARSLSFNADGIVSVGLSGGSVRISATTAAQTNQTEGIYAVGNTVGTTSSTVDARSLSINATGVISAGLSNGSYQISVPGFMSRYAHNSAAAYSLSSSAMLITSVSLNHIQLDNPVSFTRVDIPVSVSLNTAANTSFGHQLQSHVLVLYTRSASTLTPIVGMAVSSTITWQSSTGVFVSLSGPRVASFALATALSAGDYYLGWQVSTNSTPGSTTASTALSVTYAPYFGSTFTATQFQDISAATAATINPFGPLAGLGSVSLSATNQTYQMSDVTHSGIGVRANNLVIFRNV